jgi:hypothetical protein
VNRAGLLIAVTFSAAFWFTAFLLVRAIVW